MFQLVKISVLKQVWEIKNNRFRLLLAIIFLAGK
jgi:hypothetical protein